MRFSIIIWMVDVISRILKTLEIKNFFRKIVWLVDVNFDGYCRRWTIYNEAVNVYLLDIEQHKLFSQSPDDHRLE